MFFLTCTIRQPFVYVHCTFPLNPHQMSIWQMYWLPLFLLVLKNNLYLLLPSVLPGDPQIHIMTRKICQCQCRHWCLFYEEMMSTINFHFPGLFFLGIIPRGLMWTPLGRIVKGTFHILPSGTSRWRYSVTGSGLSMWSSPLAELMCCLLSKPILNYFIGMTPGEVFIVSFSQVKDMATTLNYKYQCKMYLAYVLSIVATH